MEFYIVIIIVAVIEVCLLLLLHMWVGKRWLTITMGVASGLVLLGMGLYDKYHKNSTTYKTLQKAEVSSKDNQLYFYFDSAGKATSFCDSQKECEYVIKDNNRYYVATRNQMTSCKTRSPTNFWCALNNTQYSEGTSLSPCFVNGTFIDCVGKQCPYKTCEDYYNRIEMCNNCLTSPTNSQLCLSNNQYNCVNGKDYNKTCGKSQPITNCNTLMDKYGDVPYNSNTATIYNKTCKGDSTLNNYKSCSPTMMIQTSPLFSENVEKTCSHTNECNGYVCDENYCTYVNKQKVQCCDTTSSRFCLDTTYYCKGKCGNLRSNCVST
jgi:hypothetical protein